MREANNKVPEKIHLLWKEQTCSFLTEEVQKLIFTFLYLPSDLLKLINMIRFGLRHFKALREIKLLFLQFS
jgi:hypothetical protein